MYVGCINFLLITMAKYSQLTVQKYGWFNSKTKAEGKWLSSTVLQVHVGSEVG